VERPARHGTAATAVGTAATADVTLTTTAADGVTSATAATTAASTAAKATSPVSNATTRHRTTLLTALGKRSHHLTYGGAPQTKKSGFRSAAFRAVAGKTLAAYALLWTAGHSTSRSISCSASRSSLSHSSADRLRFSR